MLTQIRANIMYSTILIEINEDILQTGTFAGAFHRRFIIFRNENIAKQTKLEKFDFTVPCDWVTFDTAMYLYVCHGEEHL